MRVLGSVAWAVCDQFAELPQHEAVGVVDYSWNDADVVDTDAPSMNHASSMKGRLVFFVLRSDAVVL